MLFVYMRGQRKLNENSVYGWFFVKHINKTEKFLLGGAFLQQILEGFYSAVFAGLLPT